MTVTDTPADHSQHSGVNLDENERSETGLGEIKSWSPTQAMVPGSTNSSPA